AGEVGREAGSGEAGKRRNGKTVQMSAHPAARVHAAGASMIERCLWTETSPLPRFPAYPLPSSTDVAIIGGGYTGLAAARALARRSTDVTVLERYTLGWGASS